MELQEKNGQVGFRYRTCSGTCSSKALKALEPYGVCNLADGTHGFYVLTPAIHSLGVYRKVIGPAVTVENPPGDNLMVHKAMALIQPGAVLVIKITGEGCASACGGIMLRRMQRLGIQAVIVDGYVRDLDELLQTDMPVFARGLMPAGCKKNGLGQINYPIACGGVVVRPGDIIVADRDGVICLPEEDVQEVAQRAAEKLQKEARALKNIAEGHLVMENVDEILAQRGLKQLGGKEG